MRRLLCGVLYLFQKQTLLCQRTNLYHTKMQGKSQAIFWGTRVYTQAFADMKPDLMQKFALTLRGNANRRAQVPAVAVWAGGEARAREAVRHQHQPRLHIGVTAPLTAERERPQCDCFAACQLAARPKAIAHIRVGRRHRAACQAPFHGIARWVKRVQHRAAIIAREQAVGPKRVDGNDAAVPVHLAHRSLSVVQKVQGIAPGFFPCSQSVSPVACRQAAALLCQTAFRVVAAVD